MLSPIFESFEAHTLTVLKRDSGEAWFLAKDFAEPMGVGADSVRHRIADLDDSDKDVISIHTPGGPQKMTFVSESGALQLVMQSRKPEARRLRKWVCDLAVRYAKGDLSSNQIGRAEIAEIVAQVVTTLLDARESRPAVGPIRRGLRHQSEFPAWSLGEHHRMRKLGYVQSSEFLTRETGQRPAYGKAGGLALRAANYCRQHEIPVHRFFKGASVVVYLHKDTLKAVYRTGWSARTAVLSEAQMGLFGGQA